MYSINSDPRLNNHQKQLFLYPLPYSGRDVLMEKLLNVESDVKEFLGCRSLRHYQNDALRVGDDINIDMISEAILVMSRDYGLVMTELEQKTDLFDDRDHHLDPVLLHFKERIAPHFNGRKLTTQHHEIARNVPEGFASFRRQDLFVRMKHRRQRQYEMAGLINDYALRETRRYSIGEYQYFGVNIPEHVKGTQAIRKWVQDFRHRFVHWGERPVFWVFMLDYHTEKGLFLRAVVSKETTSEFLEECGEEVLFNTTRAIGNNDDDTWLKDVLGYTFRKHQLISPVPSMQRVVFRSY